MNANKTKLDFTNLRKALLALELMAHEPMQKSRANVDATIQRFEFTIELFWKLLKHILEVKGVEERFPKDILIASYSGHLIDDEQVWIDMLEDRNQTSHTYNEELADTIYKRIKEEYVPVFRRTFSRLEQKYSTI